ncbi:hypothetical protein CROQUDRAFT_137194 [Cronartium quercuum f. sp. fusiforme G11]|uniref:Uncharacterized protein n=1 Tax=Cronartium quercuum f. sp. fusiforme G11 TaxID=708437 RepID=A0A9P6T5A6_9BASI|nr:hypothetical protein CROQUDRAFT_137194 [Cronartium quercuum f. sp. fusiforme G11]
MKGDSSHHHHSGEADLSQSEKILSGDGDVVKPMIDCNLNIDYTDGIELSLDNPYLDKILQLPPPEKRWTFSKRPAKALPHFAALGRWEDPEYDAGVGNVCTLKSNLHAFLKLKLSQGLEAESFFFKRIVDLFILVWNFQPSVAQFFPYRDIHALQIQSFETLASILQHNLYALSPVYLLDGPISNFNWHLPGGRRVPRGRQKPRVSFKNQYFRLYYVINARNPNQRTRNLAIGQVTWAMLVADENIKIDLHDPKLRLKTKIMKEALKEGPVELSGLTHAKKPA